MKNGATTLPRTLICPLTATLPPRNLVFPTFPCTAMMFATLAKTPIRLPVMSMLAVPGSVDVTPVSCEPLPMKNGATTLPRTFIWPLTATLPPRNLVFPTLPCTAMIFATFAKTPIRLPVMSMLAVPGSVDVTPVSCDPFPTKKGATTLPRTLICPLTATLPPRNLVFPTFPCTAMMFATLAKTPIRLPVMSILAVPGSVDVTPVSCEPLPMKNGATTLPRTFIWPLTATLPPRNLVFPTLPCTAMMFDTLA